MSRYVIITPQSNSTKSAVKKFGTVVVKNDRLDGIVEITNYRRYSLYEEVDIQFKGKIKAKYNTIFSEWLDSSILENNRNNVSKIKVNRLIRKSMFFDVKCMMNYFGINLRYYYNIKNLKWV
jgi:hypothetical protein